jgi:hypothetical protein
MKVTAEQFAYPSYKWMGKKVRDESAELAHFELSRRYRFSLYNYAHEKSLKVILKAYRRTAPANVI